MIPTTHAILESLVNAPLLVGDLPEATTFPHHELSVPTKFPQLNFEQKLGHLYEDALAILLEASADYQLLARNLQIRTDVNTTVGELDFLLRDLGNGELVHLELATKFYLAVETAAGLTLPGPDPRDNYFKKLNHLRDHQLTLTKKYRSSLPEDFRHEPITCQQLIYGCLFDPIRAPALAAPNFVSPDCRRGRWLTIDDCGEHFPPDTQFQIIPKPLWPVPLEFITDIPLASWNPQTVVDRCLMLRVDDEPSPYFISPLGYPNQINI